MIKKIISAVFILVGIVLLFFSHYISSQVAEGQEKIADAQSKVDSADSLFSLHPATRSVGKQVTGSVQKKIDQGEREVAYYASLAGQLQIGGIIVIALGGLLLFLPRRK